MVFSLTKGHHICQVNYPNGIETRIDLSKIVHTGVENPTAPHRWIGKIWVCIIWRYPGCWIQSRKPRRHRGDQENTNEADPVKTWKLLNLFNRQLILWILDANQNDKQNTHQEAVPEVAAKTEACRDGPRDMYQLSTQNNLSRQN